MHPRPDAGTSPARWAPCDVQFALSLVWSANAEARLLQMLGSANIAGVIACSTTLAGVSACDCSSVGQGGGDQVAGVCRVLRMCGSYVLAALCCVTAALPHSRSLLGVSAGTDSCGWLLPLPAHAASGGSAAVAARSVRRPCGVHGASSCAAIRSAARTSSGSSLPVIMNTTACSALPCSCAPSDKRRAPSSSRQRCTRARHCSQELASLQHEPAFASAHVWLSAYGCRSPMRCEQAASRSANPCMAAHAQQRFMAGEAWWRAHFSGGTGPP